MKPMRYAHSEGHTDLCFDDSGRYILTCGTDGDVRIWEGIDDDDAVSHRVGDRAYGIAFKSGRFFTATDANSVQASKFPDGSPDGLITRFTAPVSHMVLNSSGTTMVAGSSDFTVKVVDVASSSHKVFREHKAPVLSIALDPKEQFAASSSCDGTVRVWRLDDQSEFLLVPVEKEVQVYSRDAWELVDKISHPDLSGTVNVLALCPDGRHAAAGCVDGSIVIFDWQLHNVVEKHRHEKGFTLTALAWNPSNSHQIAFCDKEGQLGVLDGVLSSVPENQVISESVMEDSVADAKGDGEEAVAPRPVVQVVEGFKPTPLQKPFQPGSTPEHLSSRFMKWNSVGVVRQYNTEEENSIDIEFHDTATHHAMHITNNADYTMADVSTEAVVLATASDEDSNSKLMCMHFGSWDNAKEWSATMPEGEVIQAVVLGEGWLAAATSARNVRIFTVGGVQRQLFSLPGPAVCLAAHGQRLLVVYHAGMGLPGEQNMACRILRVTSQKRPCEEGSLPLTKATLSWIGEGIMRMKNASLGGIWTQVADTRENVKGKSDHYWIVGVNENPQQCIPCKGSRYPATLPRPAVTVLPFHLPLCDSGVEKSQYEEEYLRSMLFAQHLVRWGAEGYEVDEAVQQDLTRQQQTALMKLFALSARSEREFRAMEVCELMPDEHTLQLSIKHNTSETEWSTKSSIGTKRESEDEEDMEKNEDVEEEEKLSSGPMLNVKPKDKKSRQVSLARGNPFKVSSQQKDSGAPTRGSQVFDGMKKMKERGTVITPLPVSVKQTKSGQRKITVKLWMQKAKAQSQTSSEATSGESDKKRKRPDEEDEQMTHQPMQKTASKPQTKKPLSQSTNSKLANFAFSSKS
ncbi:hypothetical protein BaRGS_00034850 [Batillaria attramentaria]|uniref:WD repeat and HMG-box DNA-binding protein 1 n=1 Tax=Batillaria attramentaria TaxID=370345 RepID=A0ABD0JGD1_9CAEN